MLEKDPISLKRIICNSSDDFAHALNAYHFLLASTIFCGEEGSDKRLVKAIKARRDKANNWPEGKEQKKCLLFSIEHKCYLAKNYAVKNTNDGFHSIARMTLLILNAAFEKRIKDMLFVWHVAELNNFESKEIFFLTNTQKKIIDQNIENSWKEASGPGKSWVDLKNMLIRLAKDMNFKITIPNLDEHYLAPFIECQDENKYEELVNNKITDEYWIEIKDAYLLRNAVTHNRNRLKEQITIGSQTFMPFDEVDPEQTSINKIINSYKKINQLFRDKPEFELD